jgi:hypothetical protein
MWPALRRLIVSIGAAIALSTPALAQGHVTGTIRDNNGKPLKGATITAQNPDAAPSTFTGTSDGKGRFSLLGLRGGVSGCQRQQRQTYESGDAFHGWIILAACGRSCGG